MPDDQHTKWYNSERQTHVRRPRSRMKDKVLKYWTRTDTRVQQHRQCTYKHNIEARSYNHCCSGKAISITYSGCVSVALGNTASNAHPPYCHPWPARLYNIFPHYLINGTIFEKKVTEHKTCVLIFCTTYVWNISHSKQNWARYDRKCTSVFM
jgi:hypothetical protein